MLLILFIESFCKKRMTFKWKKIIDIIRYVTIYTVIILFSLNNRYFLVLVTAMTMISSVGQLCAYLKIKCRKQNENFKIILLTCAVELLVSMSLTYYTLYIINPDAFLINDISLSTVSEKMFEFFYLTFSIVTTYSSGIIILIGIVPRIFQVIHTVIVLTLLAKTFGLILNK